jgi:hypothetical protein
MQLRQSRFVYAVAVLTGLGFLAIVLPTPGRDVMPLAPVGVVVGLMVWLRIAAHSNLAKEAVRRALMQSQPGER